MAISRMQQPRQLYGLGSLVKSIGKTVKKVVKSPIGKAALIGAAAFGIPGTQFGGLLGRASFGKPAMSIFGKQGGIGALFANPSIAAMKTQGAEKGFLGGLIGKVPGGGYTVGAIGSILAASGMSPEEIEETKRDPEKVKIYLRDYYSKTNPDASSEEVEEFVTTNTSEYTVGGRVGLKGGSKKTALGDYEEEDLSYLKDLSPEVQKAFLKRLYIDSMTKQAEGGRIGLEGGANEDFQKYLKGREEFNKKQNAEQLYKEFLENKRRQKVAEQKTMAANGGRIGYAMGSDELVNKASGIMGLPQRTNKAGVKELDLRESGGFIPPVGVKEKADDIPAMLSNNEFVFTADAVRGMGNGNVNKGAQRMYDIMKKLEKGGRV